VNILDLLNIATPSSIDDLVQVREVSTKVDLTVILMEKLVKGTDRSRARSIPKSRADRFAEKDNQNKVGLLVKVSG
jgi:hypothetical protein